MNETATTEAQKPAGRPRSKREIERARRRRNRLLPLIVLALASFVAGIVIAAGSPDKEAAERFVKAWAKQDFAGMHTELTSESAAEHPLENLQSAYLAAQSTATATAIDPGDISGPASAGGVDVVTADVAVRTKLFGVVDGEIQFPVSDGKITWSPHLTFPGLAADERVGRHLEVGERAPILARDGTPLAEGQGAERSSPLGTDALDVTGEIGNPDPELEAELRADGYPSDISVGISGLELAFNPQLTGQPGGELLAVKGEGGDVAAASAGRTLATAEATAGEPVKTTIDPEIQEAAVAAVTGRIGGSAVLDARSGAVRGLAGAAYSQPAPPGSTFKIITTVAALELDAVKLSDEFDHVSSTNVGGRELENSNGEICGGNFVESFAHSCNTVFAPLGIEVGAKKLVDTAELFGFNQQPELFNDQATEAIDPPQSEIPTEIPTDLDVGVSAIGQGRVLATPLELASMAQTIAADGVRSPTPIVSDPELGPDAKPVKVTTPEVAGTVRNLMVEVVNSGTGTLADMGRIQVAGKTGTAELGPKPDSEQPEEVKNPEPGEEPPKPEQILDAWFAAFAPAEKPKLAVAVFFADSDGDGGQVAAPAARGIFEAALGG